MGGHSSAATVNQRRSEEQGLFLLTQHLGDGVSDDGAGFFELFLRQANCDAHLQGCGNDLLRLKIVLKCLEAGDEDTIRKALQMIHKISELPQQSCEVKSIPRRRHPEARIVGPSRKVS